MFRRIMLLLSVIAALSGTALRQAEAANDFACSLAELRSDNTIEETDGGVGDDSGATILEHEPDSDLSQDLTAWPSANFLETSLPGHPPQVSSNDGRPRGRIPVLTVGSVRQHAWLQRFLF